MRGREIGREKEKEKEKRGRERERKRERERVCYVCIVRMICVEVKISSYLVSSVTSSHQLMILSSVDIIN